MNSGGWYCGDCGWTTLRLPDGLVSCRHCGCPGLRGYDNARPRRVSCPYCVEWRGWDDGVNDDLARHQRREHATSGGSR